MPRLKTPSGKETWIPWAEPTSITDGDQEIYAAFGPKLLPIPFGVKLDEFIVDRNEGSESVAMWTSKIRIDDAVTNQSQNRKSWNPNDLKQSTLQVKREPVWVTATTWLGSLLVVLGIAVIFYAPALTKKWRKWQKKNKPEGDTSKEDKELAAT